MKKCEIMEYILNATQIMKIIPHRYPFLLLDGILVIEGQEKIIGVKNFTVNEQYFQGHFPGEMVVPGVLIVESLAQVSAVLLSVEKDGIYKKSNIGYLVNINKFKFLKKVIPGYSILLMSEVIERFDNIVKLAVKALLNDEVVCQGEIVIKENNG